MPFIHNECYLWHLFCMWHLFCTFCHTLAHNSVWARGNTQKSHKLKRHRFFGQAESYKFVRIDKLLFRDVLLVVVKWFAFLKMRGGHYTAFITLPYKIIVHGEMNRFLMTKTTREMRVVPSYGPNTSPQRFCESKNLEYCAQGKIWFSTSKSI